MRNQDFFEITFDRNRQVFCFRSKLMVYEEQFADGMLTSAGYNTAGYPLDVLSNCPTRLSPSLFYEPSVFALEIDGLACDYDLTYVDFQVEKNKKYAHAVLILDSSIRPIRIKLHTVVDGSSMFTRYLEIENRSEQVLNISRLAPLSGGLEQFSRDVITTRDDYESFYSAGFFDHDCWALEGSFRWHPMQLGKTVVDCRFDRDRFRHPMLFIRNNLTGKLYFSQIGWSGGCRFTADFAPGSFNRGADPRASLLSLRTEITGYAPLIALRPGECFTTPEVHMGVVAGDLDAAVNEMHSHIRRSVLSDPDTDPAPCLVGAGMGAEHDMSIAVSKAFIDQLGQMGAEVFIVDAGWASPPGEEMRWFSYNGVHTPNPQRYPRGLEEIADYCHEKGMKFGLWVEIERIGKLSELFKSHPHWRSVSKYGTRSKDFLDLTIPEAAQWAEDSLAGIITEYHLDLLRVDYNIAAIDCFNMRDTGSGVRECLSLRHFNAVYRMYRNLKKRFPHVIFENCASGGGRTDLGLLKAFHHTWVSDWQKAPRSVMITNGMTMALPPERVDRLVAGMGCHEIGTFDLHVRNALLGHISLNVIAPVWKQANPLQMEFLQHSISLYKSFIRPILPACNIYHHTPEAAGISDGTLSILEIAAPDASAGALTVCTLTGATAALCIIPKGIDPARTYEITLDNSRSTLHISGYQLATAGIPVSIPTSLSSALILYKAL